MGPPTIPARARDQLLRRVRTGRERDERSDAQLIARIMWSVLVEPGDGVAGRLIAAFGAAEALELVWHGGVLSPEEARRVARDVETRTGLDGAAAGFLRWQPRMTLEAVSGALRMAAVSSAVLLAPGDPEWPAGFGDLGEFAPLLLWARGRAELLAADRSVALVGSRAATGYGTHVTAELAAGLAERGHAVVSGGAYGIDATAHRTALVAGGETIAVMAGGIDRLYPAGNTELLERVVREGLVVAEVPFGTPPSGWRFLQRNRLIAAMTAATVVVEAGARSGSLNTAKHAAQLARPLGAVPGPVTSPSSAGCHRILREFAGVCVTDVGEVVALMGTSEGEAEPLVDPGDPRLGRLRAALSTRSPRSVGDVAARSGLAETETASLLGLLALDGAARRMTDGWVSVKRGE